MTNHLKPISVKGFSEFINCTSFPPEKSNIRRITTGSFEQRPWKPTIRRGKIQAELPSPGPATVYIPQFLGPKVPLSTKRSGPGYSFGLQHFSSNTTHGPGPAHDIRGLTSKGKDRRQLYVFEGRREKKTKFITPDPAEYLSTDAFNKTVRKQPIYSIRIRCGIDKSSYNPAPNVYKIPGILGTSKDGKIPSPPAYTILKKPKEVISEKYFFPGPGAYNIDFALKPPFYSMRPQVSIPSDEKSKPGPAAHCPEKVLLPFRSSPAHSFYIRHSKYLGDQMPKRTYEKKW